MPGKKQPSHAPSKATGQLGSQSSAAKSSARTTVSGPSEARIKDRITDVYTARAAGSEALAAAFPHNAAKPSEFTEPAIGQVAEPIHPVVTGSTLTESNASEKTGRGNPQISFNPLNGPLDKVRVDSGGRVLTTNQGVPIADNQNSLKAGLRGPTLREDFILREKITHFDHERIPERVVYARGSAAHGFFECYSALSELTRASIFAEAGKRTPVFVRNSSKDQYRHCKAILALGGSRALVEAADIPAKLRSGERDPGLLIVSKGDSGEAITAFIKAVAHTDRSCAKPSRQLYS